MRQTANQIMTLQSYFYLKPAQISSNFSEPGLSINHHLSMHRAATMEASIPSPHTQLYRKYLLNSCAIHFEEAHLPLQIQEIQEQLKTMDYPVSKDRKPDWTHVDTQPIKCHLPFKINVPILVNMILNGKGSSNWL